MIHHGNSTFLEVISDTFDEWDLRACFGVSILTHDSDCSRDGASCFQETW